MEYKVVLTSQAKAQFRKIIDYLIDKFDSQQAAINVANDFEDTIIRLSRMAGSLKLCDDKRLQSKEYRSIHFKHHRYLIVYTLDGGTAYIEGVYHDLQDYENILR